VRERMSASVPVSCARATSGSLAKECCYGLPSPPSQAVPPPSGSDSAPLAADSRGGPAAGGLRVADLSRSASHPHGNRTEGVTGLTYGETAAQARLESGLQSAGGAGGTARSRGLAAHWLRLGSRPVPGIRRCAADADRALGRYTVVLHAEPEPRAAV